MSNKKIILLSLALLLITAGYWLFFKDAPQSGDIHSAITSLPLSSTQTATISSTPTAADSVMGGSVRLAWFYKPPENESISVLAENFDFFILTHRDEEERDELRTLGVETTIYQYLDFVQIMDPGSCTKRPYGNQVAYQIGDFCKILKEHPSWFLRDEQGELIRHDSNVYMDAGNSEYRQFWLERTKQMQMEFGWEGVFIDNVEASLNKLLRVGAQPANYKNDSEYQAAIEGFLQYLHVQYFKPQEVPVMANIIEWNNQDVWFRYMQYLDGVMIESFSLDYNNDYLLVDEWEEDINLAVKTQALGKTVILVAQGNEEDQAREEFALGSYLLANDGLAYFRYTNSESYGLVWLYDNYSIELGLPLGPAYQTGNMWKRDFEQGSVIINPLTYSTEFIFDK